MGHSPSRPVPGTKFLVIGAGLPRTGTASLTIALSQLLGGPVYHGGTQVTLSEPHVIKSWTKMLEHTPIRSLEDKQIVLSVLHEQLGASYVAALDSPIGQFVPELLELFPEAIVVCSVRDKEAWVKSMVVVSSKSRMTMLRLILWPLSTMSHFPRYLDAIEAGRWGELYYDETVAPDNWAGIWDKHLEHLKRTVPKEKLMFFDVREGWGPLCEKLGCPVPDEPFPRVNDSRAIDDFAARMVRKGLFAWGGIIGLAVITAGAGFRILRSH